MENTQPLITLLAVESPLEAHVIKSKLESEGILCLIADENMIGVNPMYSQALGGVKVQVRPADIAKAQEILQVAEPTPTHTVCPQCRSDKVRFSKVGGILNLIGFLGFGAFFPSLRKSWTCRNCGHQWK